MIGQRELADAVAAREVGDESNSTVDDVLVSSHHVHLPALEASN